MTKYVNRYYPNLQKLSVEFDWKACWGSRCPTNPMFEFSDGTRVSLLIRDKSEKPKSGMSPFSAYLTHIRTVTTTLTGNLCSIFMVEYLDRVGYIVMFKFVKTHDKEISNISIVADSLESLWFNILLTSEQKALTADGFDINEAIYPRWIE